MELQLQKDTAVSLHEQLLTQISIQITAGVLRPGQKLPSIRMMAKRLDIHANTCLAVYKELERIGLVEIKQGSGVRVRPFDSHAASIGISNNLSAMSELFIKNALSQGYGIEEIFTSLVQARQHHVSLHERPMLFLDEHEDILPVFKAELEYYLEQPVTVTTFAGLDLQANLNSHFIVSRYHFGRLERLLQAQRVKPAAVSLIHVGSGQEAMPYLKEVPEGSLVTILSASSIILRQAEAVISALRGNDLLVRPALLQEEGDQGALYLIQRSKVVFVDFVCYQRFQNQVNKPLHLIRVLPDSEVAKIKPQSTASETLSMPQ